MLFVYPRVFHPGRTACFRTRVLHAGGISTVSIWRHRLLLVKLKTEGERVRRQPFFVCGWSAATIAAMGIPPSPYCDLRRIYAHSGMSSCVMCVFLFHV